MANGVSRTGSVPGSSAEAAAYAHWRGKDLPTAAHWSQANLLSQDNSHAIVPRSNLSSNGPRVVGQNDAMTAFGVYDLATRRVGVMKGDEGLAAGLHPPPSDSEGFLDLAREAAASPALAALLAGR